MSRELVGKNLKELNYLAGFPLLERAKFLFLLAHDLKKILARNEQILSEFNAENIVVGGVEISDVRIKANGIACKDKDGDIQRLHIGMFAEIASKVLKGIALPPHAKTFIERMADDGSNEQPNIQEVERFFGVFIGLCDQERLVALFNNKDASLKDQHIWQMFSYDPTYFADKKELWRELADKIAENINSYTGAQTVAFCRELDRRQAEETLSASSNLSKWVDWGLSYVITPEVTLTELRNKALQAYVPQSPDDRLELFLYLSEENNQQNNTDKLDKLAIDIFERINGNNGYTDAQCLAFFDALGENAAPVAVAAISSEKRLRLFLQTQPDQLLWFIFVEILLESINDYDDDDAFKIFRKLDTQHKDKVPQKFDPKTLLGKLAVFLEIAKPENYDANQDKCHVLAKEILNNIGNYPKHEQKEFFHGISWMGNSGSGIIESYDLREKLMFLHKLHAHNQDGKLNNVKSSVINSAKKELETLREDIKKEHRVFSTERRVVGKLMFATSDSYFFQGYRKQLLKELLDSKDEKIKAVVHRQPKGKPHG